MSMVIVGRVLLVEQPIGIVDPHSAQSVDDLLHRMDVDQRVAIHRNSE
jgi:ABC-type iron transport system FetAB ATPase subunit